ncbi:MAG: hypothetical protein AB1585_21235 [Thermodesulfobacteriota bacterium]
MEKERPLNRRKENRYFIEEILIEGIGNIIEVSKNGLRIRKDPGFSLQAPALTFMIASIEIKGEVRWEDDFFLGLLSTNPLSTPAFLNKRLKRVSEIFVPPQLKITPENAILQYQKKEGLITLTNLLLEVESPEPDIRKVADYVEEVSILEEKEGDNEFSNGEVDEKIERRKTCKEELITRALRLQGREEGEDLDVHFAINFLGLYFVREIVEDHVRKKVFQSKISRPLFEDFETFNILKSVVFKNLCRFFGLPDLQSEGSTLLFLETAGLDILSKESNGILETFYRSPSRFYSEISRVYEQVFLGVDPLQITQAYMEKNMSAFAELYHGYLLAYHTCNPHYFTSGDLKISLSQKDFVFSSLVYLTFLTIQFLMDKDRESGFMLSRRLKGRGMDERKQDLFLEQVIGDTRSILRNLRVKGGISLPRIPEDSLPVEKLLGKDIRFEYLLQSFRAFSRSHQSRMALRYEDNGYTHFILGKLLNSDSLDLNRKSLCIIPCRNVSQEQWYLKDFDRFELLVFKEIPKLPSGHLGALLRLWDHFQGQIIVTFDVSEFLDQSNAQLLGMLREHIVDFPSYFHNEVIHEKMIDHTLRYLQPFLGEKQVDRGKYQTEPFTMNHIKADILLTKEIA